MARPFKLNDELIQTMASKFEKGLPVIYVCGLVEITQSCFSLWMQKGEDDFNEGVDSLHSKLFITIKKAQAKYVEIAVDDIRSGRQGWQGQAWVLERVRQEFMPKQEITAGDDGKVQVIIGGKLKNIKKGELQQDGEIK